MGEYLGQSDPQEMTQMTNDTNDRGSRGEYLDQSDPPEITQMTYLIGGDEYSD